MSSRTQSAIIVMGLKPHFLNDFTNEIILILKKPMRPETGPTLLRNHSIEYLLQKNGELELVWNGKEGSIMTEDLLLILN